MAIRPKENERDLLAKIARGDELAFSELFHWYYEPLGQAMIILTESLPLAQEIVQDAFVKVWVNRASLPRIESFSNYLYILCRNHAFATLKKLAREKQLQPDLEQHLQWEAEWDELENPSVQYRELLEQVVARLPSQQRRIYELSRYHGLKYREIGKALDISPDTVKIQVYNAVKFIRKELGGKIAPCLVSVLTTFLTINS